MSIPFQKIDISEKGKAAKFGYMSSLMLFCFLLVFGITSLKIHIFITATTLTALILTWLFISILTIKAEGRDSRFAKWLVCDVVLLLLATLVLNNFMFEEFAAFGWGAFIICLIFKIIPNIVFKRK